MSSPATLTDASPNSRSWVEGAAGGGGGAPAPDSDVDIANAIALPAAWNIAPMDWMLSEYSPGVTPVNVNPPSALVRDVPPGMNCSESFITGMSMTMAPAIGLPSEPTAVPLIFASLTGWSWMSTLPSSWPTARVTRCASAGEGEAG